VGAERIGRGEFEEAIASFRRATVLQPDHVDAHVNLGVALTKLDRVDEAADSFRRAITLRPGDATARANLARPITTAALRTASRGGSMRP
jgi:Flp pilus assembly protein TadD